MFTLSLHKTISDFFVYSLKLGIFQTWKKSALNYEDSKGRVKKKKIILVLADLYILKKSILEHKDWCFNFIQLKSESLFLGKSIF